MAFPEDPCCSTPSTRIIWIGWRAVTARSNAISASTSAISAQLIEDIRQETLLRVLQIVRTRGVDHPERFGAFVSAVCNNVLMEQVRAESRHDHWESEPEITDDSVDLDAPLVSQQRRRQVETVLAELTDKDRNLLRAFFLEDRDRIDLCRQYGVSEEYLRVLLHRAKSRFRSMYSKRFGASERIV